MHSIARCELTFWMLSTCDLVRQDQVEKIDCV